MRRLPAVVIAIALVAAACSTAGDVASSTSAAGDPVPSEAPADTASTPSSSEAPTGPPDDIAAFVGMWRTDWTKTTIDPDTLILGIPQSDPRDRIMPIDEPVYESIDAGAEWLRDRDPGLLLTIGDTSRFYPLAILTFHEIVNDTIEGVPISVTYCPLCNTAVVFDRRVDGETLRFGVSGLLRNSDLVMWENTTDSLFQQITGEGIVGEFAGTQLEVIPSLLVSFGEIRNGLPGAEVLSRETERSLPYGINPYEGYSSSPRPFLFDGELDPRFPALSRVVGVTLDDTSVAYPFETISQVGVVNADVAGSPIVVMWGAGDTADALDSSSISDSQGIGIGVAYSRVVDGQALTFERIGDATYRDAETGTTWSILGIALEGPLEGERLETVPHRNEFWFAWAAFFPDGEVYEG